MTSAVLEKPVDTGVPPIPAMTTDAERECYYRLAKEAAGNGAIIELGAWMGASTAYIAAGIRDSGVKTKVQVYDKFQSKAGHAAKVNAFYDNKGLKREIHLGPCLLEFERNLGPLKAYVEPHRGQIEDMAWGGEPIALLVTDAPKRVPAISSVLTKLGPSLKPGAIMAWQDFCHFPSYEIPACLYRLRNHLEFVEAAVPGTTLVFRVKSQWSAEEVSLANLDQGSWSPEEVEQAWIYWGDFVDRSKLPLFDCGKAMFLCDMDFAEWAVESLDFTYTSFPEAITPKWRYLKENRPDFRIRYRPLFDYLAAQNAL